jgi:alpha-galactosidase
MLKDKYLAVFNLDDRAAADIKIEWRELGLTGACAVRDLWSKKDAGPFRDEMIAEVNPHGAVLYRVSPRR